MARLRAGSEMMEERRSKLISYERCDRYLLTIEDLVEDVSFLADFWILGGALDF